MIAPGRLRRLLDARGGFTLDPRSGTHVTRGVSVSLDPVRACSFRRAAWQDDVVSGWLDDHAGELARPGRFLGGWLEPESEHVWLDVVRVLPGLARPAAVLLGRRRGQRSAYDLRRGRLVPISVGGS